MSRWGPLCDSSFLSHLPFTRNEAGFPEKWSLLGRLCGLLPVCRKTYPSHAKERLENRKVKRAEGERNKAATKTGAALKKGVARVPQVTAGFFLFPVLIVVSTCRDQSCKAFPWVLGLLENVPFPCLCCSGVSMEFHVSL